MKKIFIIIVLILLCFDLMASENIQFHPSDSPNSSEGKYLYKNEGSLFNTDGGNHRYADGPSSFTYKIDLEGKNKDYLIIDVCHDFKVEMSFDDKDYFVILESPQDVHDDSNRGDKVVELKKYISDQKTIYIKFSDRSPVNGWGSCLYSFYIGDSQDKKFSYVEFSGESFFIFQNIATRGPATDIEFEKEWFYYGYHDEGEILKRNKLHQGLKLFMLAGIMDRYKINAEFQLEKFSPSWHNEKREPLGQFDPVFDDAAFVISLETLQNSTRKMRHKVTLGKIHPQYSSFTFNKRHNGIMWEGEKGKLKFTATGSRIKHFNETSEYLASGRGEYKSDYGKFGISCILDRYDTKSVSSGDNTLYGHRDGRTPAVYIKVQDRTPHDYWGAKLWNVTVQQISDGQTNAYAQFEPGKEGEAFYLFDVHGNYMVHEGLRRADENGYFIYRFPLNSSMDALKFIMHISQDYSISISYDGINYKTVAEGEGQNDDNKGDEVFYANILSKVETATFVDITISDDSPGDGWGGDLYKLEYYEDDQLKIAFSPDESPDSTESLYLYDEQSSYGEGHRYADEPTAYFTYRLPVSAGVTKMKLRLDIQQDYKISIKMNGVEKKVIHAPGNEKSGANREFITVELNSYDELYKNTYIRSGTTVVGFDYTTKIWDTELKGEFARSIEHRIYCGGKREDKGYNAWYFNLDRKIKFLESKIHTEYFYVNPYYDASVAVDDNDDNDALIDELEPYEVSFPRLEYEILKDKDNNNINDEDEDNTEPDYKYRLDQQGYVVHTTSKLLRDLTGHLHYNETEEISTTKIGQKMGSELEFLKTIRKYTSLIGRYKIYYIKDKRTKSQNPKNIKNYFKTLVYHSGIKPFDLGLGMERLRINRHLINRTTDMDSEIVTKVRCNLFPVNRVRVMPLFQIRFLRFMRVDPDYEMTSEYNEYMPGILLEYTINKKAKAYANYRYVYVDDIKYPLSEHWRNLFEIGVESFSDILIRAFYRFNEMIHLNRSRKADDWKSGQFYSEIKFWF